MLVPHLRNIFVDAIIKVKDSLFLTLVIPLYLLRLISLSSQLLWQFREIVKKRLQFLSFFWCWWTNLSLKFCGFGVYFCYVEAVAGQIDGAFTAIVNKLCLDWYPKLSLQIVMVHTSFVDGCYFVFGDGFGVMFWERRVVWSWFKTVAYGNVISLILQLQIILFIVAISGLDWRAVHLSLFTAFLAVGWRFFVSYSLMIG